MRIIYLDFETYYDSDFSLRKMTTEQYLRDPRYQTILLMAAVNDGPIRGAWGHDDIATMLRELRVDAPDAVVVAHNARFDATIIEWIFGIRCNFVACTILMMRETGLARLIGQSLSALSDWLRERGHKIPPKGSTVTLASGQRLEDMSPQFKKEYAAYGSTDVGNLRAACSVLMPACSIESLQAMNMTLQMYTRPVFELATDMLATYLEKQHAERVEALQALADQHGFGSIDLFVKQLRSKPKFAALLDELGCTPPRKLSIKKSEKAGHDVYDYAFAKGDLEFLALQEHPNPDVRAVVNARLGHNSSINESRTRSFLELSQRGPMPVPLEYAKAHTGRYGGSDKINLQNLPKRGGDKTLRHSIKAPLGFEIGGADSSQVEARLLAYAAGQDDLLQLFATGGDPYCYMADAIYGCGYDTILSKAKPPEGVKPDPAYVKMRNVGKETVLGSGYGMSGVKFAERLEQQSLYLHPSDDEVNAYLTASIVPECDRVQAIEQYKADYHLEQARKINRIYRTTNKNIRGFWQVCQGVLDALVQGGSGYFGGPTGKLFYYDGQHSVFGEKVPGIMLPNGFWLLYHKLHIEYETDPDTGKNRKQFVYSFKEGRNFIRKRIYGGALTENLIQALAFAVLKWQAIRIHSVLPVRMNVHDEWMSVYAVSQRENARELYMYWMRQVPDWCAGAPLDCEFTHGSNYGDC